MAILLIIRENNYHTDTVNLSVSQIAVISLFLRKKLSNREQ